MSPKRNAKALLSSNLIVFILLAGAFTTFFLPIVFVQHSLIGKKSWSVNSIVKIVPKPKGGSPSKNDWGYVDFKKTLEKILPKNIKSKFSKTKISLPMVLALWIPIGIAATYLLLVLGFLVLLLNKTKFFQKLIGYSVLTSSSALGVAYYLSSWISKELRILPKDPLSNIFSALGKAVAADFKMVPAYGFVVLALMCVLIYLTSAIRNLK